MDIAQLTIANGEVTAVQQLAFDDDTNGDDAEITIHLQPDVDYAAVVSGSMTRRWDRTRSRSSEPGPRVDRDPTRGREEPEASLDRIAPGRRERPIDGS
jgi:hypothetical protein